MGVPTALVGVSAMAALVALSSVLVFVITKHNAEDSINDISRRFSNAQMNTVSSEIRYRLQKEPMDAVMSAKSDIEIGELRFDSDPEIWVRRACHFFKHSGFFTLFMALAGTRELGLQYGFGLLVDGAAGSVVFSDPPQIHLERPLYVDNGTWVPDIVLTAPVNFSARDYVSMYTTGSNYMDYRIANEPRWTSLVVSVNPVLKGGGGPFITLTAPVFRTPEAISSEFIGVTCVSIYLSFFSLDPYLVGTNQNLLIITADQSLIVSTDVNTTYYANGTLPNGQPNYLQYSLDKTNVSIYHTLSKVLPDLTALNATDEYFSKFDFDGDTMWLEVRPVYHLNLRWYLVGVIPEKEFFHKIYNSNRNTMIIVIILIVSSSIVAAFITLAFTMNLTKLAIAFGHVAEMQLDHPAVRSVASSHYLFELSALYKGFWHAVNMVRQVQAFLPDVDDDQSAEETSNSSISKSHHSSNNKLMDERRNFMFSLGLKNTSQAVALTGSLRDFSEMCSKKLDDACAQHKTVFAIIMEHCRRCKGTVSYLEGSRFVITWNTGKPCLPTTGKMCSTTLALDLYELVSKTMVVDLGIHMGYAYHGILGSEQQRFNVVSSDLVDVSTHLAMCGPLLEMKPSVYASSHVVESLHSVMYHMVNNVSTYNVGKKVPVFWVASSVKTTEEEWMYQLSEHEQRKAAFLEPYWEAVRMGNLDAAMRELVAFRAAHPTMDALVRKLALDIAQEKHHAAMNTVVEVV
eukprot:TRINITY_DN1356_c3_g1_i1.p1 TRINITY_DN1356_c3_g1~~TRINITY_DN1356_c3_g1_i1.p1  ORF type:complete len:756 (+),score=256.00 TRINITY_DN1356_c3_g1_i1:44-2269(+)